MHKNIFNRYLHFKISSKYLLKVFICFVYIRSSLGVLSLYTNSLNFDQTTRSNASTALPICHVPCVESEFQSV